MRVSDTFDDVLAGLDGEDASTVAEIWAALDWVEFDCPVETVVAAESSRFRHGPGWYVAAVAVAATVVVGAVVSNLGGSRQNLALAEWSPEPQVVTDAERTAIEAACLAATQWTDGQPVTTVPEIGDPGTGTAVVPDLAASPDFGGALIDRRGDIAVVIATTDEVSLECAAHFFHGEWYAFAAGVGWGGDSTRPSASSAWNGDVEITMISGLAPGATSVEVDAPELVTGTAPVVDGRYVVWVPSSSEWRHDAEITVRGLSVDGSVLATIELTVDAAPR